MGTITTTNRVTNNTSLHPQYVQQHLNLYIFLRILPPLIQKTYFYFQSTLRYFPYPSFKL